MKYKNQTVELVNLANKEMTKAGKKVGQLGYMAAIDHDWDNVMFQYRRKLIDEKEVTKMAMSVINYLNR